MIVEPIILPEYIAANLASLHLDALGYVNLLCPIDQLGRLVNWHTFFV